MRYTNLEVLNKCMDVINADNVSAVDENDRAGRIFSIMEDVYYDLLTRIDHPYHETLQVLTSPASTSTPTHLTLSSGATDYVKDISRLEYNVEDTNTTTAPDFKKLYYIDPTEFLDRSEMWENYDVVAITANALVRIGNDKDPTYYTSFDQQTLVLDSYDSAVLTYIPSTRVRAIVRKVPDFTVGDSGVQTLDDMYFPTYVSECQSRTHAILKDNVNRKVEEYARRNRVSQQNDKFKVKKENGRPNFGRT